MLSHRQSITSLCQLMPAANRAPLRSRAPILPAAQLDGQLTHCWCIASWKLQLLAPQGARGRGVTEPDSRPARPTDAASRSRASGPPCSDPAPDTALSSAKAALTSNSLRTATYEIDGFWWGLQKKNGFNINNHQKTVTNSLPHPWPRSYRKGPPSSLSGEPPRRGREVHLKTLNHVR